MGNSTSVSTDKKIVVVGGGYAGAYLAVDLLAANANFTLIDEKEFFYHSIATVRAIVDIRMVNNLFIPYEKTFGDHFMQGRVKDIKVNERKIELSSGAEVDYDILVLATGSSTAAPYKCDPDGGVEEQHMRRIFTTHAEQIKNSQNIVIVGGGAIGCEVAGEIGSLYKDKQLTLIHASDDLVIKGANSGFQSTLRTKLQKKNVDIVLGRKVTNLNELGETGPHQVKTDDGSTYQADVVLPCIGISKTDLSYAIGLGSDCFDDKGLLKVNECLQVQVYEDIFALGDCCNADVMKTVVYLQKQIPVVFHNICALSRQQTLKKYKAERGPNFMIGVSLGPDDGTGTAGGFTIPSFFITSRKSKDMTVNQFWKGLKQTPPKGKL